MHTYGGVGSRNCTGLGNFRTPLEHRVHVRFVKLSGDGIRSLKGTRKLARRGIYVYVRLGLDELVPAKRSAILFSN